MNHCYFVILLFSNLWMHTRKMMWNYSKGSLRIITKVSWAIHSLKSTLRNFWAIFVPKWVVEFLIIVTDIPRMEFKEGTDFYILSPIAVLVNCEIRNIKINFSLTFQVPTWHPPSKIVLRVCHMDVTPLHSSFLGKL